MPLISAPENEQKELLGIEIPLTTLGQVYEYCKWAKIEDLGYFFSEAALIVLKRDRAWVKYERELPPF